MSYLVLARKYRPGTFAEIVGQEHVVRTLKNAIRLDRLHHAFLFCGARGVGKTTTARVLARALNCEQGPTDTPCGECAACQEIAASGSPDVLEIDGASNRGLDSVRELREKVRYLPSRGRYKLYIIDEVHQLTSEAFNALLKTLEEPPPHVKFIFATTEPHKIPLTILSRCQRFDFRRVSMAALGEHLRKILEQEGVSLDAAAVTAIVREAQGSVRDALSLLDQVLSYSGGQPTEAQVVEALGVVERGVLFQLCDAILEKDANGILSVVAEVDARGHDLADLAGLLVEHFRDLMVVKVVEDPSRTLLERSPGELESLRKQGARLSRPDLHRYFSVLVGVADDVSRSPHPRISLEMGLLRLLEIEPTERLGVLLKKLDHLLGQSPTGQRASSAPPTARSETDAPVVANGPAPPSGWLGLVERLRQKHPALASVLEHARPVSFGPDGVELAFRPATFYWDSIRERENRSVLTRALAEHFGRDTPLRLSEAKSEQSGSDVSTIAESEQKQQSERAREIRADALQHPAVRGAISILGGEVKEVIPLTSGVDDSI